MKNITKEKLEQLYIIERKRRPEIAKELGISPSTVQYLATKYGLKRPRLERTRPKSHYSLNECYFEKIDSPEKAYWLGFLAADGCIQAEKGNYRLQIELSTKDRGHLEKFAKAIEFSGPIYYDREHKQVYKKITKIVLCDMIGVASKPMVLDLISHGVIPRKSKILNPPTIDKHLVSHWIRGYFDGDGSVSLVEKTQHICGSIFGTKLVMTFIAEIFQKETGTTASAHYRKKKSGWELCFHGNLLAQKVEKYLYANAMIFLERKYQKFHCLDEEV